MVYDYSQILPYDFEKLYDAEKLNAVLDNIRNRRVLIYSLSAESKNLLFLLMSKCIKVEGFLLTANETEKVGVSFCGRPARQWQDLSEDDFVLLVAESQKAEVDNEIWSSRFGEIYYIPRRKHKPLILYGTGYGGEKALEFFRYQNVPVAKFCDRDPHKIASGYCGLEVISLTELSGEKDAEIVITMVNPQAAKKVAYELLTQGYATHLYYFDYFTIPPVKPHLICYFISYFLHKKSQGCKIFLYGSSAKELSPKLAALGMEIDGVLQKKDLYDLLYEQQDNYLVAVLEDTHVASKLVKKSGLPATNFVTYPYMGRLDAANTLDPNLSYNHKDSVQILRSALHKKPYKLGILGGSTSDIRQYPEKSWPEHLAEIATERGISLEIHCGAVAGYLVAQELVKFVRDMSHLGLDMLISYSGVNEDGGNAAPENYFVSFYQKNLTSKLLQMHPERGLTFGQGMGDVAKHWLHQETILHGICAELGINFHAVLQPWVYSKSKDKLSKMDKSIIENGCFMLDSPYVKRQFEMHQTSMRSLENLVREKEQQLPWLHSFSHILDDEPEAYFDQVHLYSHANRKLAEKMFEFVTADMQARRC